MTIYNYIQSCDVYKAVVSDSVREFMDNADKIDDISKISKLVSEYKVMNVCPVCTEKV